MATTEEDEFSAVAFDVKALEKELSTAIETERKRLAVDEMKKRAIKTAGTYDEFKNLVACADQKPVEAGALTSLAPKKGISNTSASTASGSATSAVGVDVSGVSPATTAFYTTDLESVAIPRNIHEFHRDWRRHCTSPQLRFSYLRRISSKKFLRIFSGELDGDILTQIIAAFHDILCPLSDALSSETASVADSPPRLRNDVKVIAKQLSVLTTADRFGLVVSLCSESDLAKTRPLLDAMLALHAAREKDPHKHAVFEEAVDKLRKSFAPA